VRPIRWLRETFTRYEIACVAQLSAPVGMAIGALLFAATNRPLSFWAMLIPALALSAFCFLASTCPACGKSPLKWYLTSEGERHGGEPMGGRLWPERECSHCRTALDKP
jgi:hypothetical protein